MKRITKLTLLMLVLTGQGGFAQVNWWSSNDSNHVFSKNRGSVMVGSFAPLGKLTVGPDDKFYNLSLVGDYSNLAKNYLQIGVTGRGFDNLQGQTIFDLYHSNGQPRYSGYNFRINGNSRFFINDEGNVGVGTEKPEARLDLKGGPLWGGFYKALRIPENHAINFDAGENQFGLVAQGNELSIVMNNSTQGPFGSPFTKVMSIQPRKLVIEGDLEVRGQVFSNGQVFGGGGTGDHGSGGSGGNGGNGGNGGGSGNGGGGMIAAPGSGVQDWYYSGNNIYYTYNGGNVGIGTSAPGYLLDVAGNQRITQNLYIGSTGLMRLSTNASGEASLNYNNSVTGSLAYYGGGTNTQFSVTNTGKGYFAGSVLIGTSVAEAAYLLKVNGKIKAQELYLTTTGWPDFVFDKNYKLRSLSEVERHIRENKHLPDVPSEKELMEKGVGVVEMQAKLLQKIEELTLYVIDLKKENSTQDKLIDNQTRLIDALRYQMKQLENK